MSFDDSKAFREIHQLDYLLVKKTGFLNTYAPIGSDLALLFQITILAILTISLMFKFRRSYAKHGILMGIAVVLHTISIIANMVPSLMNKRGMFENLSTRLSMVTASHVVIGTLVGILGIYLLGAWALRRFDAQGCFKRKRIMDVTIFLWSIELVLGIYVYALLYVVA